MRWPDAFDYFTDLARLAMGLARRQAQEFAHDYIGTEHLLLGLLRADKSIAAGVLADLNITLDRVRKEVRKIISLGVAPITEGQLPFTTASKKALELALEEAHNFGNSHIGTGHLLLGVIREDEGIAARILGRLEVGVDAVREVVREEEARVRGLEEKDRRK